MQRRGSVPGAARGYTKVLKEVDVDPMYTVAGCGATRAPALGFSLVGAAGSLRGLPSGTVGGGCGSPPIRGIIFGSSLGTLVLTGA